MSRRAKSVALYILDRRPQTADRRPQTADRRPQTADRRKI
ncbi:glycosyl transferase [Cronobacter sakazakii]|nr:glycosyl transferase [Cronobacter sakazakii]